MVAAVPQLIMPMAHDQPDNAWRMRELGVGDFLYPGKWKSPAIEQRASDLLPVLALGESQPCTIEVRPSAAKSSKVSFKLRGLA